ncbi:phospholipase B1, membrane-associated-like isoform X2 [Pygocentrus nattereri]|uniref:phospholipase B1, membrane-associated-like isoform X2 n=1 Tax=Pygocentrus nattereri TaxID=42514 RepID=UPI001891EF1E|nr:phospholipase B1, membrane-associated-like isoform X2 [Pygocentrus nattereri]
MMDARWTAVLSLLSASVLVIGSSFPQRRHEHHDVEFLWPCPHSSAGSPAALSVHSVRPTDITVLSAIGLPHTPGTVESVIMKQLHELMSFFSPTLISLLPNEAKSDPEWSSLLSEAEETVVLLNRRQVTHAESEWKLLVLFVPLDRQCLCNEQVGALVRQVDAALQVLHSKLEKVIISVVLLDAQSNTGRLQLGRTCLCPAVQSTVELRLTTAIYSHVLLESLEQHLVEKKWYSNRDDFTVQLQRVPLSDLLLSWDGGAPDEKLESETYKIVLQLWENLLQPSNEQKAAGNGEMLKIQCPSEDLPFIRTERNSPAESWPESRATLYVTGTELPCKNLNPSNTPPTSVHALRPADIQVVAALGDSLTTGNGVGSSPYNLLDVITQYRGLSWSVGGDQNLSTVTTLPNILREFNPALTGFSVDKGKEGTSQAFLNQAVAGATSVDMLRQAQALVSRMKNDSRIDFHSDWKVITLFIGGNDLCDSCQNSLYYSAENFVKRVQEALDYLHSEVPRAVVNLVEPIHIIPLRGMHQDSSLNCPTWLVRILCPCVILPKNGSKELQDLDDLNRAYQRGLVDLVDSGRYDTHSNFTVVLQPLLRDLTLPYTDGRPDRLFFSPDCFHLSQKAHTLMARGLWNNMLEPLGNKTHSQDFTAGLSVKCPSENSPFIQTYENSNYTYKGPAPTQPPISNWGSDFSCTDTAPSNSAPTSVHRLRPADISVVAALGDSITTGLGAKSQNYFQLNTEYKGVSWSIGGDTDLETTTTLPNILRKFNPSVQGFSTGQGLFAKKGFNMAVSKAKVSDLSAQVSALIEALKSSQNVNYELDWKLITLFIGGNDLCHYCLDQNNLSPQNYSHHLREGLDMLYREVPRVLVNVVTVPEMDGLRRIQRNSLPCMFIPREKCPCFMLPEDNSVELTKIKLINLHYQTVTGQLISGGRYDGREDFAVVLQPYLQSTLVPLSKEGNPDLSYFTGDCLHLSERAHAEMAIALWNNMLEPVGKKQIFNNFTHDRTKIQCPSEAQPFIYTKMNSIPDYSTTSRPNITPQPTQPTQSTPCPSTVPVWVPAVFGVIGLLLGWGITWLFLWRRIKKMKTAKDPEERESELKGTSL